MSTEDTDTHSWVTIFATRERRTTETVSLTVDFDLGEIYLDDLRHLVERAAHIPGTALVQPRPHGIDITYIDIESTSCPQDGADEAIEDGHVILETGEAIPIERPASTANGASTPIEEVRRVVALIKQATDMGTGAIADMADIPRTSLLSLMAPSYKSRTVRRSTYDRLARLLDELTAEDGEPTVDGRENHAVDRERDRAVGL